MKHTYSSTIILGLVFLFCQNSTAQKYKRLHFKGKFSVCVLVDNIADKPKDLNNKEKRFRSLQFYKKGSTFRIRALEINKKNELEGFGIKSNINELIEYRNKSYTPLDSTCILVDTLKSGLIKKKYPYVDLYLVDSFYNNYNRCPSGTTSYSSRLEHWIITEDYVYVLKIQKVDPCMGPGLSPKTKRILLKDFKKFCRSIKLD